MCTPTTLSVIKINSTYMYMYMAGKCLGPWPPSEFLDLWSLSCLNVHVHAWLLSVYTNLLRSPQISSL